MRDFVQQEPRSEPAKERRLGDSGGASASPLLPSHRRLLATPRPAYSVNEEGAKMTGSISAFPSRPCALLAVPREPASGACSRGIVSVAGTTTSTFTSRFKVSARALRACTHAWKQRLLAAGSTCVPINCDRPVRTVLPSSTKLHANPKCFALQL